MSLWRNTIDEFCRLVLVLATPSNHLNTYFFSVHCLEFSNNMVGYYLFVMPNIVVKYARLFDDLCLNCKVSRELLKRFERVVYNQLKNLEMPIYFTKKSLSWLMV